MGRREEGKGRGGEGGRMSGDELASAAYPLPLSLVYEDFEV